MPIVSWMKDNGRPFEDWLRDADLGYVLKNGPDLPIPLGPALAFLRAASRVEGPDFACRVMGEGGVRKLGVIGEVALSSRTVGEALYRVAAFLSLHVTHQTISISPLSSGGLMLRRASGLRLDDETRHLMHQYFAAQIWSLCSIAGASAPQFERVSLMPHPIHGVSHLRPWFGDVVQASADKSLKLFVSARVANEALPCREIGATESEQVVNVSDLAGDGTLTHSANVVIASMLTVGTPTIERLAAAAGIGVRTIQRRLRAEGSTFSDLLEALRRDLAIAGLSENGKTAGEMAARLGYGYQSSLSRAFRRWTGTSPREVLQSPGD